MSKSNRSPRCRDIFTADSSLEYSMRLTASFAYYFAAGFNPIQVLQFNCRGFYGGGRFSKGNFRRLCWSPRHFFISFAVAAIYVGATWFLPMLSRETVMWATIYGVGVFIVMNFVVLPHTPP